MSKPPGNLILTEEGVRSLNGALAELCGTLEARAALLVDRGGQLVAAQGKTGGLDLLSLAALMMGAFQSTRALAKVLHEREFQTLFQQGKTESLFMTALETGDMLAVVFSDNVTLGMVKYRTMEALEGLNAQLKGMYAAKPATAPLPRQSLDNLF